MKKETIAFAFAMAIMAAITPNMAKAYTYCVNESWLGINSSVGMNGVNATLEKVDLCPYGCVSNLDDFGDGCAEKQYGLSPTWVIAWIIAGLVSLWAYNTNAKYILLPTTWGVALSMMVVLNNPLAIAPLAIAAIVTIDTVYGKPKRRR